MLCVYDDDFLYCTLSSFGTGDVGDKKWWGLEINQDLLSATSYI